MAKDIFEEVRNKIDSADDVWKTHPAYYLFEGWDVGPRDKSVLDQAIADGVDLESDDLTRCVGPAPHDFQNGYLLSTSPFRGIIASNQIGKSIVVGMEILITASGEVPFAYRYRKGYDTGIPRLINKWNIIRFGRRSLDTGEILDHNYEVKIDGSWDCGNVTGVGVFPQDKIVPPGSVIRIGSRQRLILQNWWPAFTGVSKQFLGAFVPPHFIDKSRGSFIAKGSNKQDRQVFLPRGNTLQMLTYEAGKEGFEGIKPPTYLDEEPPDEDIIGAVATHNTHWSLVETPYLGITYSKDLLFPKKRNALSVTFHATSYDCPYKTEDDIKQERMAIESKPWEIGARIYGIPTESKGDPYYDRAKINYWMQRFAQKLVPKRLVRFEAAEQWHGIVTNHNVSHLPGLMDVDVLMVNASDDDQKTTWRLYEERINGMPYMNASDQAEGAELVTDAADLSTCVMGRQSDDDPTAPVIAATLRSTLPTAQFTIEALMACRYFHNALIIPEIGRGSANEAFKLTAQDYPFWFKDSVKRQSTKKAKEQLGFCPTTDRRETVFNVLILNWLSSFGREEYPNIPDEWILKEAAAAVVGSTTGGQKRCDHPPGGTIDSLIAFGIMLYGMQKEFSKQIKYRGEPQKERAVSMLDMALMNYARTIDSDSISLGEMLPTNRR